MKIFLISLIFHSWGAVSRFISVPKRRFIETKISSEECGIQERLEIVKSLLEQILFLNLSDYFFKQPWI